MVEKDEDWEQWSPLVWRPLTYNERAIIAHFATMINQQRRCCELNLAIMVENT
jgi:hypothetical protein